jgi:uncharacterized protein YkwD
MAKILSTARSHARHCGQTRFEAASLLTWNTPLAHAAKTHSTDMARHNFKSHTGSDGSSVNNRVSQTQYVYSHLEENLLADQETASAAVQQWIESEVDCSNIMNPAFTDIGAFCANASHADHSTYWTLVLGSKKAD